MDNFFDDTLNDDVLVRVTESTEYVSSSGHDFHDICAQDEAMDVSDDVGILQSGGFFVDHHFCSPLNFASGIIELSNVVIYSCSPHMRLPGWIMNDKQEHVACVYNISVDYSLSNVMSKLPNITTLIQPVEIKSPTVPGGPVEFSIVLYKNNSL